jgi:GT2 family glycosyltransferase
MSTRADRPATRIVLPTYERPDRLVRCLDGLTRLHSDSADFEVIVVDDGGSIPLHDLVDPFRDTLRLRLVRQHNAGPAAARNAGAHHGVGRLLAFIDDDCIADPAWLNQLILSHRRDPDALIGGCTVNALSANLFAQASQDLVAYLYDYYTEQTGAPAFFTSNNMLLERAAFLELGGFDTTFRLAAGEDRELCDRWSALGRPLRYAQHAVIRHYHDLTLRRFTRQHFNYGRGAFRYHALRRARGHQHTVEPLSFYSRLITDPLQRTRGLRALPLAALMVLSQAANAAGFFYEKRAARLTG